MRCGVRHHFVANRFRELFPVDFTRVKLNSRNMKTSRVALISVLLIAASAVGVIAIKLRVQSPNVAPQPPGVTSVNTLSDTPLPAAVPVSEPGSSPGLPVAQSIVAESTGETPIVTNKLDRLTQIRETFRALASGDKTHALRAAKQITDETERETALLTLITEWTQGELGPARLRAQRIASLGLEAGLGLELGSNPELALLWADEMTGGPGRAALVQQAASSLVKSDPTAAFALAERFPEADRHRFTDELFASWASHDTEAALKWAEQYPDLAQREAALQAIRTSAPVGIGAVLGADVGGYPFIADLVPGMPADRSGQLKSGDRIVAIAQANGAFVDLSEVPLKNVVDAIRGAPNTMLQLKVVPAGAAPNTPPKTVLIMRDQVKFKK